MTGVHVVYVESGQVEELRERDLRMTLAQRLEFRNLATPIRWNRCANVAQDHFLRLLVKLHVAPGRKKGEVLLDLAKHVQTRSTKQRLENAVDSEFAAMVPDEVEHDAECFVLAPPQPATQLLQKERWTVRRPKHQERVNNRHINALIE